MKKCFLITILVLAILLFAFLWSRQNQNLSGQPTGTKGQLGPATSQVSPSAKASPAVTTTSDKDLEEMDKAANSLDNSLPSLEDQELNL